LYAHKLGVILISMSDNATQDLQQAAIAFLEQDKTARSQTLREYGIARYTFLTKMQLNQANIICVMQYLANASKLKFPNLVGADLSGLILDGVTLIRGNLSHANLSNSSLVNADLLFANLTGTDLRSCNLQGATLNETIWQDALVIGCQLSGSIGLTGSQRQDLLMRGAVFSE
jgi:uncharacterized protein YjbI with pentapeptide repeats